MGKAAWGVVWLAGTLFYDLNLDGLRSTNESPLAAWTVFLDDDGDGVLDPGEARVVTDAQGDYLFSNLRPGSYQLRENQPATHLDGRERIGNARGSTRVNVQIAGVVLGSGSVAKGYTFAEIEIPKATFVFAPSSARPSPRHVVLVTWALSFPSPSSNAPLTFQLTGLRHVAASKRVANSYNASTRRLTVGCFFDDGRTPVEILVHLGSQGTLRARLPFYRNVLGTAGL